MDNIANKYITIYEKTILNNNEDNSKEIERLSKQVGILKVKKEKILDYNLNGAISDEEFIKRNNDYSSQIKELEDKISDLSKTPDKKYEIQDNINQMLSIIRQYSDICANDITRSIIDNMIEYILVTPLSKQEAKIEFYLQNGDMKPRIFNKNQMCRSDNIFKKMIEAQEKQMAGK